MDRSIHFSSSFKAPDHTIPYMVGTFCTNTHLVSCSPYICTNLYSDHTCDKCVYTVGLHTWCTHDTLHIYVRHIQLTTAQSLMHHMQVMDRDTLNSIAIKFETTPSEIARINRKHQGPSFVIFPGDVKTTPIIV